MELIRISPSEAARGARASVVALGFFDGVHVGHARLLSATAAEAASRGASPAVFTFSDRPHRSKPSAARLTDFETKLSLISEAGIELAYVADFSEVADMSAEDFVSEILVGRCSAAVAVCGFNFRFGRGARGDAALLSELMRKSGGEAIVIPAAELGGETVSSSAVRAAIELGDMPRAEAMLGRPFSLSAPVLHGRGFGRGEGVPTVNQAFAEGSAIPRCGVYAARATLSGGEHFAAVANVGVCPTFGDAGGEVHCETYLIGYRGGELYGETVRVELVRYLRPERKFESVEALYAQISSDVEAAKETIG